MALAIVGATALGVFPALAQDRPRDPGAPFAELDWNVGLRGSFTNDSVAGVTLEGIVAPEVTLTRQGERDQTSLNAGGAFGIEQDKTMRLEDAHVGGSATYLLDEASQ